MSVVKSRFGGQVQGEAMKNALDEGARQAIENNELRLASQPSVEITAYEDGKDLEAALSCEAPEIDIPDLSKLSIEKPTLEAGDAEVDEALNIADGNRPSVEVTSKRAAKAGDIVVIDYRPDRRKAWAAARPKVGRWNRLQQLHSRFEDGRSASRPARHAMLKSASRTTST